MLLIDATVAFLQLMSGHNDSVYPPSLLFFKYPLPLACFLRIQTLYNENVRNFLNLCNAIGFVSTAKRDRHAGEYQAFGACRV